MFRTRKSKYLVQLRNEQRLLTFGLDSDSGEELGHPEESFGYGVSCDMGTKSKTRSYQTIDILDPNKSTYFMVFYQQYRLK